MAKDTKIRRYWLRNAEGNTIWLQNSLELLEQLKYGGDFAVGSRLMTIDEWRQYPKQECWPTALADMDIQIKKVKEHV